MKPKIDISTPPGFDEYLPAEQMAFDRVIQVIKRGYELYGFSPIETPAVERKVVLTSKGGNEKEIYSLSRLAAMQGEDSETDMALHFDLTVPLARYVVAHQRELVFPFRRYQIQKVWRGERSQVGKGRYREFYQCDIDVIGKGKLELMTDAEIPSVIHRIFKELDIGRFVIKINNRKVVKGYLQGIGIAGDQINHVLHALDGLEKDGRRAVKAELTLIGLTETRADAAIAFIERRFEAEHLADLATQFAAVACDDPLFLEGVDELARVVQGILAFGVPADALRVDLGVIRGLDYYTGTIYETTLVDHPDIGSICSGGRYENLTQYFAGSDDMPLPGVGISIGITRLFSRLLEKGLIATDAITPSKVLVTTMDRSKLNHYLAFAEQLRQAGISTEVYLEPAKLRDQLAYANKKGFLMAVIAGEDEFAKGQLQLKDLRNKEAKMIDAGQLLECVLAAL